MPTPTPIRDRYQDSWDDVRARWEHSIRDGHCRPVEIIAISNEIARHSRLATEVAETLGALRALAANGIASASARKPVVSWERDTWLPRLEREDPDEAA